MEAFARSDAESPQGMDGLSADLLSSLIRIAPEDFAAAVETALRRIGERLDVDIATIVEFDGAGQSTDGGFHWVRHTLTSADVLADIKRLAALMHSLDVGSEPMILERIPDQLPRELLARVAFDASHGLSMKSAVMIPMIIPGQCSLALAVGVCTGYRSWPERFIEGLRLMTEVIIAAWQRRTQELALRQSREEVARLSTHPDGDDHHIAVLPERAELVEAPMDDAPTPVERAVATADRTIDTPPADHRSVRVS